MARCAQVMHQIYQSNRVWSTIRELSIRHAGANWFDTGIAVHANAPRRLTHPQLQRPHEQGGCASVEGAQRVAEAALLVLQLQVFEVMPAPMAALAPCAASSANLVLACRGFWAADVLDTQGLPPDTTEREEHKRWWWKAHVLVCCIESRVSGFMGFYGYLP